MPQMSRISTNMPGTYAYRKPRQGSLITKAAAKRESIRARQAADVKLICNAVARAYNIPPDMLQAPTRGEAHVARARQVAMYLAHVAFGMSLGAVGRQFDRDRTTAAYACRQIEDLRDEGGFDFLLERLESALSALYRARTGCRPAQQ